MTRHTLRNRTGMTVGVVSSGASVTHIRHGEPAADLVLGFDDPMDYLAPHPYFGATIGRYANRVEHAEFVLDGSRYRLTQNDGPHSLHGGSRGFDRMPWSVQGSPTPSSIQLSYTSAHGEQGYPGVLVVTVRCSLDDNDVFRIEYEATSDRPTVVNLTNHSYFNLGGQDSGSVLGHELAIDADAFLPVKAGLIPTGEVRSVSGTPFDFRRGCAVGAHIGDRDEQLQLGGGYDHCFVLRGAEGESRRAARLIDPVSGRVMELHTTCPGLQLYTGNQLTGTIAGKAGTRYRRHDALCLEPQRFPNAPNVPWFPAAVLRAGERYRSATEYRFSNI